MYPRVAGTALFLLAACGGRHGSQERTFVYRDTACQAPAPDGGTSCREVGDGATYQVCEASSECPPSAPHCRTLGLYLGGDYSCNSSVRVCRPIDRDDCAR